mmetsp:Transcript_23189/g.16489  ORF Transcript_23189/g.16489 Transcript_23189/m.16489 type:complete len:106 (-) Transcript_23189:14-331(-)
MQFTNLMSCLPRVAHCEGANEDRPYLGCSLRSMMDEPGMMILLVNTESPGWHGDLKVGDILKEIDGVPINKINDYYTVVNGKKRGDSVTFKVDRKGVEMIFKITF